MRSFSRILAAFRTRRKWRLHELSDWVLAPLGAISFLIAGYWSMAVAHVLPDLVATTNQNGLTWSGAAVFMFLGGLGITIWFYHHLAKRCNKILFKRHFN